MPAGGGSVAQLGTLGGPQALLSISPDGAYLLVDTLATYAQFACCKNATARVYPAGGGAAQPIATNAIYPAWWPSGHVLAFATPQPHPTLHVVAEPGGAPRTIATSGPYGAANGAPLQWTAAGLFAYAGSRPTLLRVG